MLSQIDCSGVLGGLLKLGLIKKNLNSVENTDVTFRSWPSAGVLVLLIMHVIRAVVMMTCRVHASIWCVSHTHTHSHSHSCGLPAVPGLHCDSCVVADMVCALWHLSQQKPTPLGKKKCLRKFSDAIWRTSFLSFSCLCALSPSSAHLRLVPLRQFPNTCQRGAATLRSHRRTDFSHSLSSFRITCHHIFTERLLCHGPLAGGHLEVLLLLL